MIRSIRHKGLRRLYHDDDPGGVNPEHVGKLRNVLARLDAARTIADLAQLEQFGGSFRVFAQGGVSRFK
jgi:plasmid maintenance system killer protein